MLKYTHVLIFLKMSVIAYIDYMHLVLNYFYVNRIHVYKIEYPYYFL